MAFTSTAVATKEKTAATAAAISWATICAVRPSAILPRTSVSVVPLPAWKYKLAGKHAGQYCPKETADAVYAECIKRIVVFEKRLETDHGIADQSSQQPNHEGLPRHNVAGSRCDGDQAGDQTGGKTESSGFAFVEPLGKHPAEGRRRGRDLRGAKRRRGQAVAGQSRCLH